MAYTDVGTGGRVYSVGEEDRLLDAVNRQEAGFLEIEKSITAKKDIIRYSIIGVGSILILVLLKFAIKNKK
jgi:hypothetical protein